MKRLGQLLTDLGWVTPNQLATALDLQAREGGRLGACLLELGALDEEQLHRALSHQLGVPAARPTDLETIPSVILGLIPADLAQSCRVVPFRMLGNELHIAMGEVGDLEIQDRIAFAAGKMVRPFVVSDLRLRLALAEHYQAPLGERYRLIAGQLGPVEEEQADRAVEDRAVEDNAEGFEPPRSPRESVQSRLEELANATVEALAATYPTVLLFKMVRGDAVGWNGQGRHVDAKTFANLRVSLEKSFLGVGIADSGGAARRSVLPMSSVSQFLGEQFGDLRSGFCLVQPVEASARLAALLVVQLPDGSPSASDWKTLSETADGLGEELARLAAETRALREPRDSPEEARDSSEEARDSSGEACDSSGEACDSPEEDGASESGPDLTRLPASLP